MFLERGTTMINWEELKHIHVIRKLEGILAQWFHTDIFFVDERGQVRNFDLLDRHKEFKNPLATLLLQKEKGREFVMKSIAEANEKVFKSDVAHVAMMGPTGVESVFVSRITVDNEFLGRLGPNQTVSMAKASSTRFQSFECSMTARRNTFMSWWTWYPRKSSRSILRSANAKSVSMLSITNSAVVTVMIR
jgi:hypothetical protein